MQKSPITCHVLDASIGRPAEGIEVSLQIYHQATSNDIHIFSPLAQGVTDSDGRCSTLLPACGFTKKGEEEQEAYPRIYKIVFKPKTYFQKTGRRCFYPWIEIPFEVENPDEHYHIPLLITPFSFTTYRGS